MSDPKITKLLHSWVDGDDDSFHELMEYVASELRRIAGRMMARERAAHTWQPTELVSEVCLKLIGDHRLRWQDRAHFYGTCGRLMRRILVDHARERDALKRGGDRTLISLAALSEDRLPEASPSLDLLLFDQMLTRLEKLDPRQAKIAELRLLTGLNHDEVASCLGYSDRTIKKEWTKAKVWLTHQMT